jgi:hypothetical protein
MKLKSTLIVDISVIRILASGFLVMKYIAIILLLKECLSICQMKTTSPIILQPTWPRSYQIPFHKTMLTEWFVCNRNNPSGRSLTYVEFPSMWCQDENDRSWKPRQDRKGKIGHLYYVHPSVGEKYYLRMLLLTVKGTCSYEFLRTYNNTAYSTFKEACQAWDILGNDREWFHAFDEASVWATSA